MPLTIPQNISRVKSLENRHGLFDRKQTWRMTADGKNFHFEL